MNEEQRNLARQLWEPAMALLVAVTEHGDVETARSYLVPDRLPDLMSRLFNLLPLYTLLYGHVEGGYVPVSFVPAERGYWLEVGAYTDPQDVRGTIKARTSLLMELHDGQWRVASIRPFALSEVCTPARIIELAEDEDADENIVGLLLGKDQAQLSVDEELDEVEELVITMMSEAGFTVVEQAAAVRLWREFKGQADPEVGIPDEWAAALEHLVGAINGRKVSLTITSAAYGIPTYTIEERQRALMESVKPGYFDQRFTIFDQPALPPPPQSPRPKWIRRKI